MVSNITYQDWEQSAEKEKLLIKAIAEYKASPMFRTALEADAYFSGHNTGVAKKTVLRAGKVAVTKEDGRKHYRSVMQDVVGNRIGSAFLFRFVTQQNQYLLSEGVILQDAETKRRLGCDFDRMLVQMGEKALHGVCWGFWNVDHLELIPAAQGALSGFFALQDEMTGEARIGVQFWQLGAERSMWIRLFENDGATLLRREGKMLQTVQPKRPYILTESTDALGQTTLVGQGYGTLPVLPLYANGEHHTELTPSIKAKIDAYDTILSDFADNLERANDVYWVLNNFGGTMDEAAEILEQINRLKAVAAVTDGTSSSSSAEPKTIEVPYAARQAALTLLERALYRDWMALDMDQLTGGSLTNVAIRAATAALDLKADRYEWQVMQFVRSLLRMLQLPDGVIRFRRQTIANESEMVQDIAVMRGDIDRATALRLNPYIQEEEVSGILRAE